jgi:hypothetical protein
VLGDGLSLQSDDWGNDSAGREETTSKRSGAQAPDASSFISTNFRLGGFQSVADLCRHKGTSPRRTAVTTEEQQTGSLQRIGEITRGHQRRYRSKRGDLDSLSSGNSMSES